MADAAVDRDASADVPSPSVLELVAGGADDERRDARARALAESTGCTFPEAQEQVAAEELAEWAAKTARKDREEQAFVALINAGAVDAEDEQLPADVRELLREEELAEAALGGPGLANVQSHLDWLLEKVCDVEAAVMHAQDVAARRIAMQTAWLNGEMERLARQRVHLQARIRQTFPATPEQLQAAWHTKKKSVTLPHGTLGFRADTSGDRAEVLDPEAALAWAKENGVDVQVVEKVLPSAIKTYVKATGDFPDAERDGIRWVEKGPDRFYCKPAVSVVE